MAHGLSEQLIARPIRRMGHDETGFREGPPRRFVEQIRVGSDRDADDR